MLFINFLIVSLLCIEADIASPGTSQGQITHVEGATEVVIPLSEVWALDMPGTKDIRKLDTRNLGVPLTYLQTGSLGMLQRLNKHHAEPAFVVEGVGQQALENAHEKLPKGQEPKTNFENGSDLSLVFFSHGLGRACHIQEIKKVGDTLRIAYHLFPLGIESGTEHIALIPLGKLPVGEYKVKITQVSLDKKLGISPLVGIDTTLSVCQPTMFSVLPQEKHVP